MKKMLLIAVFVGLVLTGCDNIQNPEQVREPATEVTLSEAPEEMQTFEFVADADDTDVLSATLKRTEVEYKQYDFGAMVESISGQKANQSNYWALYLNEEYAMTGADQTLLNPGDRVQWVFEEIKQGL